MFKPRYNPAMRPDRFRLAALFHPQKDVTYEQFSRYWLREHGKLFMSLDIVKKNLTKYEQLHLNPQLNTQLSTAMNSAQMPFWGMAIFEAESYDKIIEVLSHPDYIRVVFPDEAKILDRSKSQVIAGEFATIHGT